MPFLCHHCASRPYPLSPGFLPWLPFRSPCLVFPLPVCPDPASSTIICRNRILVHCFAQNIFITSLKLVSQNRSVSTGLCISLWLRHSLLACHTEAFLRHWFQRRCPHSSPSTGQAAGLSEPASLPLQVDLVLPRQWSPLKQSVLLWFLEKASVTHQTYRPL